MTPKETLESKCKNKPELTILVFHVMSKLNLIENILLNGKFQDHLIDCKQCRNIYLTYYNTHLNFLKGYKEAELVYGARKLLQS